MQSRLKRLRREREEREKRKREEKAPPFGPYTLRRVYAHTLQALHTDGTTELALQLALKCVP